MFPTTRNITVGYLKRIFKDRKLNDDCNILIYNDDGFNKLQGIDFLNEDRNKKDNVFLLISIDEKTYKEKLPYS